MPAKRATAAPGAAKRRNPTTAPPPALGVAVRQKYGAVQTEQDGIRFASKAEAKRWTLLRIMEQAGRIKDLQRQVSYDLHAHGGNLVGRYVADHVYRERQGDEWALVIEDVKGMPTPLYDWKRRHILAEYGIEIREVR